MKANRKFTTQDEAVSPVIATILMVAITVVLAATVYVWVSGFGAASNQPAKSISLAPNGPIDSNAIKTYTISAATNGMRWSDLKVTLDGAEKTLAATCTATATTFGACSGATAQAAADIIDAGDVLKINAASGQTLRILDAQANSVMLTLVVG